MTTRVRSQVPAAVLKARKRGLASLVKYQTFRRLSLLAFTGFIAVAIIRHELAGSSAVAPSPVAYCPFGGAETLYRYITSGGEFVPHIHLSNIVLFGGVLLTALVARSAFCGWVCPLGFIQEIVSGLSAYAQKRVAVVRRAVRVIKAWGGRLAIIDRLLRLLKYGVLIWAVTGTAVTGVLVFRDYDPWAVILHITELSLGPGLVILATMLVASLFVERPWCRYACPLGAISGLVAKLSPVYVKRTDTACKPCTLCTQACPMGLPVHTATTIKSADCNGCLECMEACPRLGALELKVGLPVIGS